ncbi:NACHT domain-containing NTPase [Calothrix sp. PCC 7507]|uniref:NACHT domain-containing protein n=1 Tax=Calothrix sp. PCC 7507 TaxID=99598 RepID=UPI00029EE16E|nr:NACHT domain-containing protein [Calothrix sp. PCC 7507]AFY32847.1 putative signal transduction protein with Nacht domain [Calothrix sp. PCC 7507]
MTRRSLQASSEGINKAQAALIRNSLTQQGLAGELGISRQPVTKFFHGKPVDRYIFVTICEKLNLNWEEIVASSSFPDVEAEASISEIESLLQTTREKVHDSIQRRCNVMRVLNMEQPMRLDEIYTDVNILERVTSRRRLDIEELLQDIDKPQKWFPGLAVVERYDKLMILGKPGTGKTTFLKWLAILCNLGEFQGDRLPIFITLKDFAEAREQPNLLEYITQQLAECGVVSPQTASTLLTHGRVMVLLDGLDAVKEGDIERVSQEIRHLTTRFYASSFAIASRIAAREYIFEQFTEVEIADFNYQQITNFVTKWFQITDPVKTSRFLDKLQASQPLQELATNPLLLTFLCLVFADRDNFANHLAEIYQEGLDIFLQTWDAQRHIQRSHVNQPLSRQQKEELLGQIAGTTLEQGKYIFPQKTVEQEITKYIRKLAKANSAVEILQLDSEAYLKSITAQHGLLIEQAKGIYSFSHIAFQQYLAEKHISVNS